MKVAIITILGLLGIVASARDGRRRQPHQTRPHQPIGGTWMHLYEAHNFQGMPYRLMRPYNFDSHQKYPVIISLHGAGGKGTDNRKQLKIWNRQLAEENVRKKYPCYVLAPQATELWNKDHFMKIKAIIKSLPSVDEDRIYILGASMGGHGTYIMIQIEPNYFAAAAPSCGSGLRQTEEFIDPRKIKGLPIWAFHGSEDRLCPYARERALFEAMKRLGGNMKLTTWKGDKHDIGAKFIPGADNGITEMSSDRCDPEPDFLKWLFSKKRKKQQ